MGFFTDDELQEQGLEGAAKLDDLDKEAKESVETLDKEPQQKETPPQNNNADNIPAKYKGKSIEDVIKMHMSAEDLIRKHSDEVGFARRMAEELVKRQETVEGSRTKRNDADPEESNVDFFADPVNAVKKAVETHPDVVAARETALETRKRMSLETVTKAVGDPAKYFADPEFIEWVQANPFRGQALRHADLNMDANAAIEIFETYNLHQGVKASKSQEKQQEVNQKQATAKKAAIVDGGSPGEKSAGPIYKRADIIRLQNTDPDRYERLMPQIMKAYAEGRVK